jgi:voltage-gated potassium channel
MPAMRLQRFQRPRPWHRRLRHRLWREWCFLLAIVRHLRWRFLLMMALLGTGAMLFTRLEPEKQHSPVEALWLTWSLIFGEAAEDFPESPVLQSLFFLVPILGLTIIVEGIIDLAQVLRDRRRYERSWCLTMAGSLRNHIVLVGLGRLGFQTWEILHELDESIVVVETEEKNPFLDRLRETGTPFLIGDGRRDQLLLEAGVANARSIVLATDNDLANMEMALDARRLNPKIRVVLRMFDQVLADKIREGFDIHLAMSQSALSAPAFATAALGRDIVHSFVVGSELVVMQRLVVEPGGPWAGRTAGDVAQAFRGAVVEHRAASGGAPALFPPPGTPIGPGDELIVQGPFEAARRLTAANR